MGLKYHTFTVNNYTKILDHLPDGVTYIIFGQEIAPTTGTLHIQGYVQLTRDQRSTWLTTKLSEWFGAHPWNVPSKGSVRDNQEYCSKQNQTEFGTPVESRQGHRSDLDSIKELIKDGASIHDIAESHFGAILRYRSGIEWYIAQQLPRRTEGPEVIWIYGDTGTGKSKLARLLCPDITRVKFTGRFYSKSPKKALIEEMTYTKFPLEELLEITDRYDDCEVEIKGGFVPWRPSIIIFTSEYHPTELGFKKNFLRRITRIITPKHPNYIL